MGKRLRILGVSPEAYPWSVDGGLAEAVRALGDALAARGHKVDLLVPFHGPADGMTTVAELDLVVGGATLKATVRTPPGEHGVRPLLLDVPGLFDRAGVYGTHGRDHDDNCARFTALCRAAMALPHAVHHRYDVLHVHDWPAALGAYYLREARTSGASVGFKTSVLTVHNFAFQGLFWAFDLPILGYGPEHWAPDRLEFFDKLSLLKAGLVAADRVVTVSPSYAREVITPEQGRGLDGVLRARGQAFSGILHGIDPARFDPATDRALTARYSDPASPERRRCAQAFRAAVGLPDTSLPLMTYVGDLGPDRGADTLLQAVDEIVGAGAMLVVITRAGQSKLEGFRAAAARHPERVAVCTDVSDAMSRRMLAGTDFLLCPSRHEPFHFLALAALRYGAVPVVRRVGALRDTVRDISDGGEEGTGVAFVGDGTVPLMGAVRRAVALFQDAVAWQRVQQRGTRVDISCAPAAERYEALFLEALGAGSTPPAPATP